MDIGYRKLNCASLLLSVLLLQIYLTGCSELKPESVIQGNSKSRDVNANLTYSSYRVIPTDAFDLNPLEVELGRLLFHDKRLSSDNTKSCSSCHSMKTAGVDNLVVSVGVKGRTGDTNAPTVFNSAFNFRQFWDGRVNTLEQQVSGPVNNPRELDSSWPEIIVRLSADEAMVKKFGALYDEGITAENIASAIANFERSLVTVDSRFDLFLRGNADALNEQELKGFRLFDSLGCNACHQGVNLGGNMYQVIGVMRDYFADKGEIKQSDYGLYNLTKDENDKFKFKVPGLRNVALTAPYFHDGSAKSLEQAVSVMAYYQLGLELEEEQKQLLVSFLKTLTGKPFMQQTTSKEKL